MSPHHKMPPSTDTLDEGPFVLGYAMSFFLMGILFIQGFIYFSRFSQDRVWLKALVAVVLFLETLITIFVWHSFWVGATGQGADLSSIVAWGTGGQELSPDPLWSFVALAPLTGIVSLLTHGFFCWRIWVVRRSWVVPIMTMMVSLLQCAMLIYGGVVYGLVPDLDASHPMPFYIPVWLCGSLFCDLTITVYTSIMLYRTKSQFKNTWSLSAKLIKLTIETGLVTTTAAAIELVLAIVFRVTMFHMALFFAISKLYANCLLAMLNARLIIRNSMDKSKSMAAWDYSDPSGHTPESFNLKNKVIEIHTEVEMEIGLEVDPMDKEFRTKWFRSLELEDD